ncbi:slightly ste11-like protein [Marasmius sp. AFHP31]|nr:slightly ste11-like protein [Marasmius sp. AFHP31]
MSRKGKERQRDDDNDNNNNKNDNKNSKKKSNLDENGKRIKRPLNCFFVYRPIRCRDPELKRKYPDEKLRSKAISEEWRAMSEEERKPWKDEAARRKKEHEEKYPDWAYMPNKPAKGKKRKNSEDEDKDEEVGSPTASPVEQPKPKRVKRERSSSSVGPLRSYESLMDIRAMPQPSTSRVSSSNPVPPTELHRALQSVASGSARPAAPQRRDGLAGESTIQRLSAPFIDSSMTTPGTANARSPVDGLGITPWSSDVRDLNGSRGQPSTGMFQSYQQPQAGYTVDEESANSLSVDGGHDYLRQGSSVTSPYNPSSQTATDWSQAPINFPFPDNYQYPFSFAQELPAQSAHNSYHHNFFNANANGQDHEGYLSSQLTFDDSQQYQDQPEFSQGFYSDHLTLNPSLYYPFESQLQSDFGPFVPDDVPAPLLVAASEGHATAIEAVQDLGFDTTGLFVGQQELDVSSGLGWNGAGAYYKSGDDDDEFQTPGAGPSGSGGASY